MYELKMFVFVIICFHYKCKNIISENILQNVSFFNLYMIIQFLLKIAYGL